MSFAVDQQLGTTIQGSGVANSVTLTTTNAVSPGGLIIAVGGVFSGTSTTFTISGGGLTWTQIRSEERR